MRFIPGSVHMQFEVAGIFCYRSLCNAFLVKEDTDWVKNVYNMRWRAADQEVDQRGRGERLCRKIAKHVI